MGGSASRFDSTDWETVSGGVTETIDSAEPTNKHTVFTLTPRLPFHQRSFHVHDHDGTLVYTTRALVTTLKWFEVLNAMDKPLLRVHTNPSRRKWEIYTFEPNWPEQAPEGRWRFDKAPLEKPLPLYRKACVYVSANYQTASVHLYLQSTHDLQGIIGSSSLLRVEAIKSTSAQYQTFVPSEDESTTSDGPPPLVGFWSWEGEKTDQKIILDLANGTDAALHIVLAIAADLVRIDLLDLTVPLTDRSMQKGVPKEGEERFIIVALWKERNKVESLVEPSDEKFATEVEKDAENAVCVTMGEDGKLYISKSKHEKPVQTIVRMLSKMMITVGILHFFGILAMGTAASDIEAAARDRPKREVQEEDLAFLVDKMEPGWSALIASYSEEQVPLAVAEFKSLGTVMVWYAPESRVEEVVRSNETQSTTLNPLSTHSS